MKMLRGVFEPVHERRPPPRASPAYSDAPLAAERQPSLRGCSKSTTASSLGVKKSELTRAAGLRPGNVRRVFSKSNPNVDLVTLYRLMNPLGLHLTCS